MSTNGDIEIAVSAEGVDEAAADLGGDGDGGGPPGGGGQDGQGGLRGNLRSGAIAGALISALGPLLDVVSPILQVLNAFLAPVATMLLRLLAPVLRVLLTRVLPVWLGFMDFVDSALSDFHPLLQAMALVMPALLVPLLALEALGIDIKAFVSDIVTGIGNLAGDIWGKIKGGASWITEGASNIGSAVWDSISGWANTVKTTLSDLPSDIWEKMKQLSTDIAQALAGVIPGASVSDVPGTTGSSDPIFTEPDDTEGPDPKPNQPEVNVGIQGGLNAFVDGISTDPRLDL